jgi:hypothetical protein
MQLPVVEGHYYLRDDGLIASAVSAPSQAEADRWTLMEGDIPIPTEDEDEDVPTETVLAELQEVLE